MNRVLNRQPLESERVCSAGGDRCAWPASIRLCTLLRMLRSACIGVGLMVVTFSCGGGGDDGASQPGTDDETANAGQSGAGSSPSPAAPTTDEPSSEPAAPMPSDGPSEEAVARGGISLHIEPVGDCYLGDTWLDFPETAGGHPVTATSHDSLLEDSTGTTGRWSVGCTWQELATSTTVSLAVHYDGEGDQELVRLSPKMDATGLQPGTLRIITSDSLPTLDAPRDQLCEYQTIDVDLDAGHVWGSVRCDLVASEESAEQCGVSEGYFYFENCVPFVPD